MKPTLRLLCTATICLLFAVIFTTLTPTTHVVYAQASDTASICVLAFNDADKSQLRTPGEALLPDVSVYVMVNSNVVVANYITDGKDQYCFTNLVPQQYTVKFGNPLYQPSTLSEFSFTLAAGERKLLEYGAIVNTPTPVPADDSGGITVPATTPVRIGISVGAAVFVMVFVAAIGLILYGLFGTRRR